jgi:hypothetical protein
MGNKFSKLFQTKAKGRVDHGEGADGRDLAAGNVVEEAPGVDGENLMREALPNHGTEDTDLSAAGIDAPIGRHDQTALPSEHDAPQPLSNLSTTGAEEDSIVPMRPFRRVPLVTENARTHLSVHHRRMGVWHKAERLKREQRSPTPASSSSDVARSTISDYVAQSATPFVHESSASSGIVKASSSEIPQPINTFESETSTSIGERYAAATGVFPSFEGTATSTDGESMSQSGLSSGTQPMTVLSSGTTVSFTFAVADGTPSNRGADQASYVPVITSNGMTAATSTSNVESSSSATKASSGDASTPDESLSKCARVPEELH